MIVHKTDHILTRRVQMIHLDHDDLWMKPCIIKRTHDLLILALSIDEQEIRHTAHLLHDLVDAKYIDGNRAHLVAGDAVPRLVVFVGKTADERAFAGIERPLSRFVCPPPETAA